MLLNLHVGWPTANIKCGTKNIFLSKKVVGCTTFVNWPTGQPLSTKVKIWHLQWATPGGLLRLSIFLSKEKG